MEKSKEIIEVLNDLVLINNDRIGGYERAVKELKEEDHDLKSLFEHMILESQQIKSDLVQEVQVLHGETEKGTTEMGKIYRGWMGLKAIFTGASRHAILSNCEYGEDAAQKAYNKALETEKLPAFLREMLKNQQETLKVSHDEIRDLRNQYV
ncbi:MAG: PA2169 family four-helix-bundle protein [Bacteroidota bacterium]|nr:PA2169 family four-helix-bundle protein [Bacteroidota bacterium]MDP4248847.1 PA2169 family four-helix-bundle protein [Bacteroidota bacterium]